MITQTQLIDRIKLLGNSIIGPDRFLLTDGQILVLAINLHKHIIKINKQCKNKIENVDDIYITRYALAWPDQETWLIENNKNRYFCRTAYKEDSNFYFNENKFKDKRRLTKSNGNYYNNYYATIRNTLKENLKINRIN